MLNIFFQPKTSPIKVACYFIEASDKRAKHNDENKSKAYSFIFRHPIYLIHLSKVVDDHLALNSKWASFPSLSAFNRWLINAYILLDCDRETPEQWFAGSMDRASDFGSEGSGFESLVNRKSILFTFWNNWLWSQVFEHVWSTLHLLSMKSDILLLNEERSLGGHEFTVTRLRHS